MDGFAWSFSFHFPLYFFEAAEVSFRLFLEFGELGLDESEFLVGEFFEFFENAPHSASA